MSQYPHQYGVDHDDGLIRVYNNSARDTFRISKKLDLLRGRIPSFYMRRRKRSYTRLHLHITIASLLLIASVAALWIYGANFRSAYNDHLAEQDTIVKGYARSIGVTGFVAAKVDDYNLSKDIRTGQVYGMSNFVIYGTQFDNATVLIHNCSFASGDCDVSRGMNVSGTIDPSPGDTLMLTKGMDDENVLIFIPPPSDKAIADRPGQDERVREALLSTPNNISTFEALQRLFKGDFETGMLERFKELQGCDNYGLNLTSTSALQLR